MPTQQHLLGFTQDFYTQLPECYVDAQAATFSAPKLVYFNQPFAQSIAANFPKDEHALATLFSAQVIPDDAKPIAQAYAGHQFGHFNPQLGDGRAMILGELSDTEGHILELDLKGSGPTNFARRGDGKAAIGPMLREVLISEFMHGVGIPSTRSLAVVTTGEQVYRDPSQAGAVLARTATSHIRIGTFQYFAAREQTDVLSKLVDYCIERHYPFLDTSSQDDSPNKALALLQATIDAQAKLVAQWMGIGFVHGVMNTDNMLIGAETIDYGPCAFMDSYDPTSVFSSIDQNSRYAYVNQPPVTQWNLARFAETLIPLLDDDRDQAIELATQAVRRFSGQYDIEYRKVMSRKLGIAEDANVERADALIQQWTNLLQQHKLDWTNAHSALSQGNSVFEMFEGADANLADITTWHDERRALCTQVPTDAHTANPAIIPRNHLVEEALNAVIETDDYAPFERLLSVLQNPYEHNVDAKFKQAASTAFNQAFVTYCGT